jgi:hypothetical protein
MGEARKFRQPTRLLAKEADVGEMFDDMQQGGVIKV